MSFEFTKDNLAAAHAIIAKYPTGRQKSALLPCLELAQRQNEGWLSKDALEYVASFLNLPPMHVLEVASFYTMFNLKPVGQYHVQICGTTPCWLRGADQIKQACMDHLNIRLGETTADNLITLTEVECLGACVNAPVVQINDDFFEDLDPQDMVQLLKNIQDNKKLTPGSFKGRQCSKPIETENA